ncbi:MAG: tetratricopeptide repeat protein [Amaricoccus sp.]|uniref:tetratricopeptide repeat protein n=1 Tax=Amaricoccus sp. TaxID=1872485 RepID=UPI0039E364EB
MRRVVPWVCAALALAAIVAAGPAAWGRLALRAGAPGIAAPLLEAPRWRGVALYEAGRYDAAELAFQAAGRGATYNRGNTLALAGRYELAADYFDAALYADPTDADARANRALVEQFITRRSGDGGGTWGKVGVANAAVEAKNPGTYEMHIQALMRARPRLPRPSDSIQSVDATADWLRTLPDDPGRYVKLTIAAEHERRVSEGTAPPPTGDPW